MYVSATKLCGFETLAQWSSVCTCGSPCVMCGSPSRGLRMGAAGFH